MLSEGFRKGTRPWYQEHASCHAECSARRKVILEPHPICFAHTGPLQNTRPLGVEIALTNTCDCRFSSEHPSHVCRGMCPAEAPWAGCCNRFYCRCHWKICRICSGSQVRGSETYFISSVIKIYAYVNASLWTGKSATVFRHVFRVPYAARLN